jgi:hypothetical protein
MTGMVGGNKWSFDDFNPMEVIPTSVCLTTYDGGPEDFILTPLDELVEQVAADKLRVQVGRVFKLDEIVEAHRCMEVEAGRRKGFNRAADTSPRGSVA